MIKLKAQLSFNFDDSYVKQINNSHICLRERLSENDKCRGHDSFDQLWGFRVAADFRQQNSVCLHQVVSAIL